MSVQIRNQAAAANVALSLLKCQPVQTLDGETPEAFRLRLLFGQVLETLLAMAPWDFATGRANLPQGEAPPFGFTYSYALPADCVTPIEFNSALLNSNVQRSFVIEGRAILTNDATGWLRYVRYNDNPADWSAEFVDAFSYRLASSLAFPLTGNADLAVSLGTIADRDKIPHAKRANANRQAPPVADLANQSPMVSARYL